RRPPRRGDHPGGLQPDGVLHGRRPGRAQPVHHQRSHRHADAGPDRRAGRHRRPAGQSARVMTGFIESPRFPDFVSVWAQGGRGFKTTVVETYGGDEYRNAAWTFARGEWQIQNAWLSARPNNSTYNWQATRNMFMAARGQLYAFR